MSWWTSCWYQNHLAGLDVQADQRVREQVVAGPVSAVGVVGGRFHAQVDVAQRRIGAERAPYAGVAGVLRRIAQPRLGTGLALARNGVERPQLPPRADVEAHDVGFDVGDVHAATGRQRGADHNHVVRDHRRRTVADPPDGVELGVVVELREEIDGAGAAECGLGLAGLGIERYQLEAGRHDHNPLVALPVGPIGHAAVHLARRLVEARALVGTPRPQRFTGCGTRRHHRAPRAGREVQDAVHHQRRGLGGHGFAGRPAVVVELPGPRHLQVLDVVAIDQVQRGIGRAAFLRPVGAPLVAGRAALSAPGHRPRQGQHQNPKEHPCAPVRHAKPPAGRSKRAPAAAMLCCRVALVNA